MTNNNLLINDYIYQKGLKITQIFKNITIGRATLLCLKKLFGPKRKQPPGKICLVKRGVHTKLNQSRNTSQLYIIVTKVAHNMKP